jgi:hypothetical protein
VWVTRVDGSDAHRVSPAQSFSAGAPRWSPDGIHIAFDAKGRAGESGNWIYVVGPDFNAAPLMISPTDADCVRPSWSADGRWVYFSRLQSGSIRQIWKAPASGGNAVQITRGGGFDSFESSDGRFLYYTKGIKDLGLWRMPVPGGSEKLVCPLVRQMAWGLTERGVIFLDPEMRITFLDPATGRVEPLSDVGGHLGDPMSGLAVNAKGTQVIYVESEHSNSEMIMLEGSLFR